MVSVRQTLGADAGDPAAFLSESVHEIFDEYYSVSLSFWTKMGLREKARQGLLTGSLGWGLVKGEDGIAVPDERAPVVLELFTMYATGNYSDKALAEWLHVKGHRTTRGARFTADTVRDMLRNTAYCGYVSAQRDQSKAIKGKHEAIVPEELFDRVQAIRRQRTRTATPGRPSERYVLRGLARCRRCHGKMQGRSSGKNQKLARYVCASRRTTQSCDQPLVPADEAEWQLVKFIEGFAPTAEVQEEILRGLAEEAAPESHDAAMRREALEERLRRMRDLYELGDLDRAEYVARRNAINAELEAMAPRPLPNLHRARRC
jgi:site-specific DNA recombinase